MKSWHLKSVGSFFVPGGLLLAAVVALLNLGLLPVPTSPVVRFYSCAAFGLSLLLAWRFHSARVLSLAAAVLLADLALQYACPPAVHAATARFVFDAIALLLPINFLIFGFLPHRGLSAVEMGHRLALVASQSFVVLVAAWVVPQAGRRLLQQPFLPPGWFAWTRLPQPALFVSLLVLGGFVARFVLYRKPAESGPFWSLLAFLLALRAGGTGSAGGFYMATAALVLAASLVEASYLMAYHDELTGLFSRRAFNETILGLEGAFAIAMVDVDHFKSFNDTYGHDTGDQVLRMVASQLARVGGGGKAFRHGGEEFAVIFPGKSAQDAVHDLEGLRQAIELSRFRVRAGVERRKTTRGSERRRVGPQRVRARRPRAAFPAGTSEAAVTVSIGVAEPGPHTDSVEQVIEAADQALYRAKAGGRNRVESEEPVQLKLWRPRRRKMLAGSRQ